MRTVLYTSENSVPREIRPRGVIDKIRMVGGYANRVIGIRRGQRRQVAAIKADAVQVSLIGIFAFLAAVCQKIDAPGFFVDVDDAADHPWPLGHLVFQPARLLIVEVQMVPAVPLGRPEDFSGVVKESEEGLPRIDVTIRLFTNHNLLLSDLGVYGTQLDGLFASLVCFVIKSLAVWKPFETRPSLKLNLQGCGFHIDALRLLHVKDDRLGFGQHFSGQRVDDGECLGA